MVSTEGAEHRAASGDGARSGSGVDRATTALAVDLLSHWWSRPLARVVETWTGAADVERGIRAELPISAPAPLLATSGQEPGLLDEYERLFVGPGPVPCPPYESFWREDVPIDLRRSLMGPCTAELRQLYGELGIEVAAECGELPDHVAVELEGLSFALSSATTFHVAHAIWSEHLRRWLPRLCRAVASEAEPGFYQDLAQVTLDWVAPLHSCLGLSTHAGPAAG